MKLNSAVDAPVRTAGTHWPRPLTTVDLGSQADDVLLHTLLSSLRRSLTEELANEDPDPVRRTISLVLAGRYGETHHEQEGLAMTLRGYLMVFIPWSRDAGAADLAAAAQALLDETRTPASCRRALIRLAGASRDLLAVIEPESPRP
ncbi:hypothetical protein [Streptomyces sp. NPDC056987]|uniref:hypothetical protein n=1 Tax=Streptomyces sp. NPDC056987 TaxID=3345988 RepID=UPI003635F762